MTDASKNLSLRQLVRQIDYQGKLLRAWPLTGGVSAQVTALEIEQSGGRTRKLVVRQYGAVDLQHNPHLARDEYRLLQLLQSVGLAAPTPVYFDQSGTIFPTPYIVTEYVEGATEVDPSYFADAIPQLAAYLARLHAGVSTLDLAFLPQQAQRVAALLANRPTRPDATWDEGRIRDCLEAVWPLPQRNPSVLLHGDFWPGNVLWRDGRLAAVIDWEDAVLGDPLADLANARLEILWAFGLDAMQEFTQQYLSLTTFDFTNLPYWDLCAALRPISQIAEWGLNVLIEKSMRDRHKWFVEQAIEAHGS